MLEYAMMSGMMESEVPKISVLSKKKQKKKKYSFQFCTHKISFLRPKLHN
jgi:hypothetical protein